jgi:mRNA interferase MazF
MANHSKRMKNKILLVPFPFDDFSKSKLRPCICLTEPIGKYEHVVVAFITSKPEANPSVFDIEILESDPDFLSSGLLVSSCIRLYRLLTIPISIIERELGFLPEEKATIVKEKLSKLFGF